MAKALEKKVAFYESDDLRNWTWTSDFGPMGDNEKSWECPDLFQLTVEESGQKKWVLVVSVNWAREQYFVGDFDGKRFIPDRPDASPLYVDDGLDYYASRVFQDYDGKPTSRHTPPPTRPHLLNLPSSATNWRPSPQNVPDYGDTHPSQIGRAHV